MHGNFDVTLMCSILYVEITVIKGAQYSSIIHEVLVAMGGFPAGVRDEILKEESQRLDCLLYYKVTQIIH